MIPILAIKKAIEGGYKVPRILRTGDLIIDTQFMQQQLALDPTFWQALGTALGWKEEPREFDGPFFGMKIFTQEWQLEALRFCELVLTSGDTTSFWEDLLK